MGLREFFSRMVDPEALGDQCIAAQEKTYHTAARLNPNAEPHELLANVWLVRTRTPGNKTPGKVLKGDERKLAAYANTMQFACVPPPNNVRALGIWFIYQERPDIYERIPKFRAELEALMAPVHAAGDGQQFHNLYRQFNPNMAKGSTSNS